MGNSNTITHIAFQAGGVRILQLSFVVSGELRVRVKPWFKQILEAFVCGLSAHNGFILKSAC